MREAKEAEVKETEAKEAEVKETEAKEAAMVRVRRMAQR